MFNLGSVSGSFKSVALAGLLGLGLALSGCGDDADGGNGGDQAGLGDRDWNNFGENGDIVLGDPDAPVSIIEYASVTCGHCAQFQVFVFPFLEEEYINTGLVRYTMRPLPTPPTNMARLGFMIARCVPEDRYYNFIDALMRTQGEWAFQQDSNARTEALARIAAQAGMSRNNFDACRLDQEGLDALNAQVEASAAVGVRSTPTFFINGQMYEGAYPWDQFEQLVLNHLPEDLHPAQPEENASDAETPAETGESSDSE